MLTLVACDFRVGESGDFLNVKLELTFSRDINEDKIASMSHPYIFRIKSTVDPEIDG